MAFGTQLGADLGGFWSRKWSHVGTKVGSKMDVNLKWSIFKKTCKTIIKINILGVGRVPSWLQNWAQDGSQNGVPDKMHLNIDFWSISVDFGTQVGVGNGAKTDQKSIPKSIKKRDCFQEGSGWLQKAAPLIDPARLCHNYATTKPQLADSGLQDRPGGGD